MTNHPTAATTSARNPSSDAGAPDWQRHFAMFWDAFLTVAVGAGLFDAAQRGGLWNVRGLWILILSLAFLIAHRWLWAPVRRGTGEWPPLYRDLLIVLGVEFILVIALLPISAWFALLILAMMGQTAAAADPFRWRLPFAVMLLTLAEPIGLYDALAMQRWGTVAGLTALIAWLPVIFLYIRLFFDDRQMRAALERDLRAAQEKIERITPLLHRLDELQRREQALTDLRDGMQHTLAYLNLRIDAIRQRMHNDPASTADELAELHNLVQQQLNIVAPGTDERMETTSRFTTLLAGSGNEPNGACEATEASSAAAETSSRQHEGASEITWNESAAPSNAPIDETANRPDAATAPSSGEDSDEPSAEQAPSSESRG
jgi:hypothetical protein